LILRLGKESDGFNQPEIADRKAPPCLFERGNRSRRPSCNNLDLAQPTVEAENEWVDTIKRTAIQNLSFRSDCTPGYYNGEGRAGEGQGLFDGIYGPGPLVFFPLIRAWRADGKMDGLTIA